MLLEVTAHVMQHALTTSIHASELIKQLTRAELVVDILHLGCMLSQQFLQHTCCASSAAQAQLQNLAYSHGGCNMHQVTLQDTHLIFLMLEQASGPMLPSHTTCL